MESTDRLSVHAMGGQMRLNSAKGGCKPLGRDHRRDLTAATARIVVAHCSSRGFYDCPKPPQAVLTFDRQEALFWSGSRGAGRPQSLQSTLSRSAEHQGNGIHRGSRRGNPSPSTLGEAAAAKVAIIPAISSPAAFCAKFSTGLVKSGVMLRRAAVVLSGWLAGRHC